MSGLAGSPAQPGAGPARLPGWPRAPFPDQRVKAWLARMERDDDQGHVARRSVMVGRPSTPIGTFGTFGTTNVRRRGRRVIAETRFRDADGRLRRVTAPAIQAA